ncbi:alpha/beta hydrolase [Nocardia colli]|uniref:Alpha/beta hydrolase n=1 Tax=Nocardia colli TaxID=2545717 RepID=A0A5N0EBI8_9NOCA|nr:alpha/beta hydrolase [Nocardia colli]KAA8885515.1 alpha/beta hydrolase [Nocardia colli]
MTDIAQRTQGVSEWVKTRDGRRLHATVLGSAQSGTEPTVVFEAGSAVARWSWAMVQPGVARFARAVAYDRSGLGRSAPDLTDRTLSRMADDLNEVLDHFGPGRFVLVGHSAGGPIVRLAAARRLDRIAGLVLIDPTDEAADVLFGPGFRRLERGAIAVSGVLARLGLMKVLFRGQLRAAPDDVRRDMEREAFLPSVIRTQRQQARTFLDELATWRGNPPDHESVPVTVISGALAGEGMNAAMRAAAIASHAHRADRSPLGRHVMAENSCHNVPATDPDLIVREIARMVRTADDAGE